MNGIIRTIGRLVAVGLVALLLTGLVAEVATADAKRRSDFGTKELFKFQCELYGGTFSEDGLGNTECHFSDGSWIECDASGNDCWTTTPFRPLEPARQRDRDSRMEPIGGGTVIPVPVVSPAEPVVAAPIQP